MKLVNGRNSVLDDEISRVHGNMQSVEPGTEEYKTLLDRLERLVVLRQAKPSNRISPDTIVIVVGGLVQVLIIVGYEHGHVIASRGLQFILGMKPSNG